MPWNHKEADFQWKSSQHSHTFTRTQHLKIPTYKTLTLIYECVCVCSHSFTRSCSFFSFATKIKFASGPSVSATVQRSIWLCYTRFTFRIEYIFIYIRISFEKNDNFSLRCTWGSSCYVRIAAFHLSQTKWGEEKKTDKNNQITWNVCVSVFYLCSIVSRFIYLFILCDKMLPVWYEIE